MKGRKYGEFLAGRDTSPNLTIHLSGLNSFVMRENPRRSNRTHPPGLVLARKAITSGDYDMVILDELNVAADFELIPLDDVIDLIKSKPAAVDLILTGRYAPPEVIALADTVSEIREVRHHYNAGVKERAGIEY